MAKGTGGGMGSRVVTNSKSARKIEPRSMAINPRGVSQIGSAMGNHATDSGKKLTRAQEPIGAGKGYATPMGANTNSKPIQYGNSGTQAMHGPVAGKPAPQGRDILSDFGPDSPIVGTRK